LTPKVEIMLPPAFWMAAHAARQSPEHPVGHPVRTNALYNSAGKDLSSDCKSEQK
jgi:hypothetical protein